MGVWDLECELGSLKGWIKVIICLGGFNLFWVGTEVIWRGILGLQEIEWDKGLIERI